MNLCDAEIAAGHDSRVRAVATSMAASARTGERAHVAKGGVHHVVPLPADARFTGQRIDTSELRHPLHIDLETAIAVVEPGVTFEELVRLTLPHGLAPTVVPELRGITVGGAVAGCSLESMSFRYGGFHDSCLKYEVISGDGRVLTLSPEEQSELFAHIHGSYGTLGVLTSITFRLIPVGPFVAMTYEHHRSFAEFETALLGACDLANTDAGDPDLVDGIVHGHDHFVLASGRFVDRAARPPSDYSGTEIYYRSTATRGSDLLSTEDYFFRYDTECHWLTRTVPPLEWAPVRRLTKKWLLGSTNLITWSNRVAPLQRRVMRRPDLVCDVFIPAQRFGEFFEWYVDAFDFWPLWIVPYRPAEIYPWIGPAVREALAGSGAHDALFIDAAVYGAPNRSRDRDLSVELEEKVFELGGLKTLIGRNHYDRDRFWQTYDRPAYEKAKAELDPAGLFPDLYDKLGRVN